MPDQPDAKPEPQSFADLPLQPTGSGVADEQAAFLEAQRAGGDAEGNDISDSPVVPTEGGTAEAESEAQPS